MLVQSANYEWCLYFKRFKNIRRRLMFNDNWNEIHISVSKNTAMLIYLCIVYGCFCVSMGELNSSVRDSAACKSWNIYYLALWRNSLSALALNKIWNLSENLICLYWSFMVEQLHHFSFLSSLAIFIFYLFIFYMNPAHYIKNSLQPKSWYTVKGFSRNENFKRKILK